MDSKAVERGTRRRVPTLKPTQARCPSYIPCMTEPIFDPNVFDLSRAPRVRSTTRAVEVTRAGASFGSALAIAISWNANHSILWAIVHGLFSWFYVLYYALTR